MRGIMDTFTDPGIEEITMMASSQVGKTEFILNVVGYTIDQDPCPMLIVEPTILMAEALSKDRIDTMIRDTVCLQGKVADTRRKDKTNTIHHKRFQGGHITLAGSNSPASLASRPVRYVLFDEVDRFEASIGNKESAEGDPIQIGKKRAITFWNRKYVYVSSPTVSGVSRIEFLFNQSDQRHCFVPCPKCGHFQKLIFSPKSQFSNLSSGRIVFDEANLSWVYYECEKCKAQLTEADKYKMIRASRWDVTKPEIQGHAGFHISELYSPWSTWKFMVEDFLKAKKLREKLQVWVNTSTGETWNEEEAYTISEDTLLSRREEYTKVPAGVLLLTAGIDTQDDRLELAIKGWGMNNESWLIDYRTVYGTPIDMNVWRYLDDILLANYEAEDGLKLRIECACIDSAGHYTQEVYKYVRGCGGRRVFAIVGRAGPGRPFIGKMTRNNRERARLIPIGVDDAKSTIYRRLALEKSAGGAPFPPGYMHFPMSVTDGYFSMLTAEKQVIRRFRGFPTKAWVKKSDSARNEALDCEVYAMAAMAILNPNWEALTKRRGEAVEKLNVEVEEPEVERDLPAPKFRRRKNWVTNF